MKLKDIEVGKEYADLYGHKTVVLEVGVYGRVFHDRMVSDSRSSHKHYVKVVKRYGRDGSPVHETIHYRSIAHDWETQEKIDKKAAETINRGEAEVANLWSILEKHTGLTRRGHWPSTRIELNHHEVEKVCEALERFAKDAGERHNRTPQN